MLHKLIKGIAPVFVFAAAMATAGCDGNISIDGEKGVALADLDYEGRSPKGVVLAGPDRVVIKDGRALAIDVSGDPAAVAALRFTLSEDTLGIMRKKGNLDGDSRAKATVTITLPVLEKLTLAGSGSIDAASLAGASEVVIAGSGTAHTARIESAALEVTIAGSGTYRAAGKVDLLELTVAGSGTADMRGLEAERAEVTIAGSGSASFASNGTVDATVMGSGDVTVRGDARCTIKSMGSGTLNCERGSAQSGAASGSADPAPPAPPDGTMAPPAPQAPPTPE